MATRTARKNTTKTVTVIARYFIKRNGHVVYTFRGSHGERYSTTVINSHATGCTCPARLACKHMAHAEAKEQARTAQVEEIAAEGDKSYGEAVEQAYAELATTKQVSTKQVSTAGVLSSNRGFSFWR